MQKIIIDTNVLVSAIIQKGYPYLILTSLSLNNEIQVCISEPVMKEYKDVLKREKFSKYSDFVLMADILLVLLEDISLKFEPQTIITVLKDVDDNKFLELAEASKADFLITGNTNDFTITTYKKTKIVTPKEYWESFATN